MDEVIFGTDDFPNVVLAIESCNHILRNSSTLL